MRFCVVALAWFVYSSNLTKLRSTCLAKLPVTLEGHLKMLASITRKAIIQLTDNFLGVSHCAILPLGASDSGKQHLQSALPAGEIKRNGSKSQPIVERGSY